MIRNIKCDGNGGINLLHAQFLRNMSTKMHDKLNKTLFAARISNFGFTSV